MASIWRRAMVYLGLVDDDEYDEYDPYPAESAPPPRPVRRTPAPVAAERSYETEAVSGVRTLPPREPPPDSGVSIPKGAVVRAIQPTKSPKVHVVAPGGFKDAQEIGDRLKANQPVIVNLQGVDRELSRRLIDFASGLSYGLGGAMEKVAESVFLLTPTNVEVSPDEKRRLQERGLYRS